VYLKIFPFKLPPNLPTSTPAALGASPILPRSKKTPSPQLPQNVAVSRLFQEDSSKLLEETKAAMSQLSEEFSTYRKEKAENER
jgi:nucleoprotein TPR